jgi:hypothetical protein
VNRQRHEHCINGLVTVQLTEVGIHPSVVIAVAFLDEASCAVDVLPVHITDSHHLHTLVLEKAIEEIALPLNGKKKKLTQSDWLNYYCKERLQIPEKIVQGILAELSAAVPQWRLLISRSYLSPRSKDMYAQLLDDRLRRLGLNH